LRIIYLYSREMHMYVMNPMKQHQFKMAYTPARMHESFEEEKPEWGPTPYPNGASKESWRSMVGKCARNLQAKQRFPESKA
jgi:hypothetical protein